MFEIADLRQCPRFFDQVASRIWHAFWQESGKPLAYIEGRLRESLEPGSCPAAFVAHEGSAFLGTASLIACDVEERPDLTPWVAAVWVEPEHRGRGIGRALVDAAAQLAMRLGHPRVYLCSGPRRRSFYEEIGWRVHEENVPREGMAIFARERDDARRA